jgi:hypothetical protein
VGPQTEEVGRRGCTWLLGRSSGLQSTEVDDAHDGSWRCCFAASALLGCLAFARGGRCGQASLPPAPSYGLQLSDEGIGLPIRHCLVLLCYNGGDAFSGDAKPLGFDI